MGQALADSLGVPEPPMPVDRSAKLCLQQIDGWTADKSGMFLSFGGRELPW